MGSFYVIPIVVILVKLGLNEPQEYIFIDLWFLLLAVTAVGVAWIVGAMLRNVVPGGFFVFYCIFLFGLVLFWGVNGLSPGMYEGQSLLFYGWHKVDATNPASYVVYTILLAIATLDIVYLVSYIVWWKHTHYK